MSHATSNNQDMTLQLGRAACMQEKKRTNKCFEFVKKQLCNTIIY